MVSKLDGGAFVHWFVPTITLTARASSSCVACPIIVNGYSGPCRNSRPALEQLASSPSHSVPMAIIHEDVLQGDLTDYQVRAFPTHILFHHATEVQRVEGANIPAVRSMVETVVSVPSFTSPGQRLGSSESTASAEGMMQSHRPVSRLLQQLSPAPTPLTGDTTTTDSKMDVDNDDDKNGAGDAANYHTNMVAEEEVEDHQSNAMTDVTMAPTVEDSIAKLDPAMVETLTNVMGFSLLRAQKGLLYGATTPPTIESAVEWITQHQDDEDIDQPITICPQAITSSNTAKPQSYKCNECGKILSNIANLELHANKTGHSDFEESLETVQHLTPEEKAAKLAEMKELLRQKQIEREQQEKEEEKEREKQRRFMAKEMAKTREQLEAEQRKREAELRKKEKMAFKMERERLKQELAKDKAERAANKGKMTSKLGIDGYNPDGIQYDVPVTDTTSSAAAAPSEKPKKPKASTARIDEYIAKVSSYKAAGDGEKCLKVLMAYIGNLHDNPNEIKFRSINMENKAYKTRVKPFIGGKQLLLAVGFNVEGDVLTIPEDEKIDISLLAQTKEKIQKAIDSF